MKTRGMAAVLALVGGMMVTSAALGSTVVFDNLSGGYKDYGNWIGTMYFADLPGDITNSVAMDFTPSKTGILSDLWTGMSLATGQNTLTLTIRADNGGAPGATLWQQTYQNGLSVYFGDVFHAGETGGGSLQILNAPKLIAGTRYWLHASAPEIEGLSIDWYTNNVGDKGSKIKYSSLTGETSYDNVERLGLTVAVVPLPLAVWPGLGLIGSMGLTKYFRRCTTA